MDRIECQFCKSQTDSDHTTCDNCGAPLDLKDLVRGYGSSNGPYDSAPPKPGSWGGRSV